MQPAAQLLATRPLGERYGDALVAGGELDVGVIEHHGAHALFGAVAIAFKQHRPLVLSPDAVWLTIAQGVAQHVRLHAEHLRARLVRHDGRERLTIVTAAAPDDAAGWHDAIAAFRGELAREIGDGRARLFECDFSTSTDVELLASQVVLLDADAPYFSYFMHAICGIPRITLTGTVDDWQRIRARLDVIAELELHWWCDSLVPIVDQFVRAAAGDADVAFWQRIYNPVDSYGGDLVTGWITRRFPYVKNQTAQDRPNPMLELPIDEPKGWTSPTQRDYRGPGPGSDAIPSTRSKVSVHVVDHAGRAHRRVAIVAGLVAVAQDRDGALRPIAGWHVEPADPDMTEVLDRIARDHRAVHWIAYRTGDRVEAILVLGTSLAALLDAALDSGGDVDHLAVCTFDRIVTSPGR